jgi:hypothetical protein
MERAVSSLRDRAEEIARETMERRREQRVIEEEARVLHERKMTIYEDAEPGPLDELRFPPGLERGASESEVSTTFFHSSEPTTETLVEEPDQAIEAPAEVTPEKVTEKPETDESPEPEIVLVSREEPSVVKEFAILSEEPVVGPEQSQDSISEPEEEVANLDEFQASQEAAPAIPESPTLAKEQPLDHAPPVPLDRPASPREEVSDTQSEHLSSSVEFPRPNTPHPTFDDPRLASPVPFPLTNDPEDQGYGTQDDEDRTAQVSQRAPGKHVHWGGVEAQPAYPHPTDEEDRVEEQEHSPPFSRLLLPAPEPAAPEPQRDVRPERAARIAARRAMPPAALQKPMRKFEQGVYTMMDVRWGMALDLSGADNRSLIAFEPHGWENQQVRESPSAFFEMHKC